jgi:glucose 1-dehydrogenase
MAAAGARVLAIDKDALALTSAFPEEECIPVVGDLSEDGDQLADRLISDHGPIELIVNNVGIDSNHRFLDLEPVDFDLVFNTNLRGPWFFTRRLVQALLSDHRKGAIIFISSVHDTFIRLNPHYSASKAAVSMLAKEMAYELAPHGIRVNVISPGWVFRPRSPEDRPNPSSVRRIVPLGRPGKPDDIARMAVVLLSDECSGHMTGENVRVDGGQTLLTWSE